jgi:hypothetical protein
MALPPFGLCMSKPKMIYLFHLEAANLATHLLQMWATTMTEK